MKKQREGYIIRKDDHSSIRAGATPPHLTAQVIDLYSRPGDLVYDPMMGQGTTGMEALRLGRNFAGVELETHRYDRAVEQLRKMKCNYPFSYFNVTNGDALDPCIHTIARDASLVFIDPPWGETRNDSHSSILGWHESSFGTYDGTERTARKADHNPLNWGNMSLNKQLENIGKLCVIIKTHSHHATFVITVRDYRKNNAPVRFPHYVVDAMEWYGFSLQDHAVVNLGRCSAMQSLNSLRQGHLRQTTQEVFIFKYRSRK